MARPVRAVGYRAVLRLPGVPRVFAAAVLGRLSYATLSLSLLFGIRSATGSYADAGAALGAFAVTSLAMPLKSRLVDRFGRRRVLPVLAGGFAVAVWAVAAAVGAGVRASVPYVALATVAGLAAPSLGPVMRAVWAALAPDPPLRQRAYSLDGVVEESLYAVGPLVVGAVVAVAGPARGPVVALAVTGALNLVGAVGMATAPVTPGHGAPAPDLSRSRTPGPLRVPGFAALVGLLFAVGAGLGPLELAVVARSSGAGHPGAAGWVLAGMSVGSAAGGIAWGHRRHRRSASVQLAGLVAVLAAGSAAASAVSGLPVLAVVLVLAGAAGAPVFVVAYLTADALVPDAVRTEAGAWVNTAYNVGLSVATAGAGVVVDRSGPGRALLAGAAVLALAAVLGAGSRLPAAPGDPADLPAAPGAASGPDATG